MYHLSINNKEIHVEEGISLLEAALANGFHIPAMCHNGELEHFTSCMMCLVKEQSSGNLLPSCSVKAEPGMDIITDDDEIREARKTALELLLSEHAGDCEAPCRLACPAFMNIPLMNRLIAANLMEKALDVVMHDIALPGVLGRICPAPCEGACKRKPIDQAVAICLLKRAAADHATSFPRIKKKAATGKKAAIIGAGPAGLSAAYYLQINGIQACIFDNREKAGGSLRYEIPERVLDPAILDREIRFIEETGVEFRQQQSVDASLFKALQDSWDAVVLATGNYAESMNSWGIDNNGKHIIVNKNTYQTNLDRVFAIGNANRSTQLAIRSLAQGREVADAIEQMLSDKEIKGRQRRFNSVLGKLNEEEFAEYLKEGSQEERVMPLTGGGFSQEQARKEAGRCLHCDCRKPDNCKLRDYSDHYQASRKRFGYGNRKPLKKYLHHKVVVFEPGKCIKCGICVRLTAKHKETFGFTFIGRGFDTVIGIPFNEEIGRALQKTAAMVADACPTGALARLTDAHNE